MPRKHPVRRVVQAKPKPPRTEPKPVETAKFAPPPRPTEEVVPLTELPKESAARLVMEEAAKQPPKPAPAKPKPVTVAKQTPPPKALAPKPAPPPKPAPAESDDSALNLLSGDQSSVAPPRVASLEPNTGAAQKSTILFAPGKEEPPQSAFDTLRSMAPQLSSALFSGTAHIQLEAYGGPHNDKGSDSRRLSLKRALIIRQLLIDDGIPSERIVVRAMGGAPSGAADRVDIFVAA
jgi:outer membrane protein OmpA-like peptidoglycan-associated protein